MKLKDSSGALRATKNSGLQPAMDFILEHNDDPIPDATSSAQPQSEPIIVDDEDLDDAAALGLKLQSGDASQAGSAAAAVEARVSRTYLTEAGVFMSIRRTRASNVQNAGRYSKTRRSPTSTQRKVGTISSRSLPRRCVLSHFLLTNKQFY